MLCVGPAGWLCLRWFGSLLGWERMAALPTGALRQAEPRKRVQKR